jgi:hypothetical protein
LEGSAEGVLGKEGEVVTRQVYENVRLDHLLSKELFSAGMQRHNPLDKTFIKNCYLVFFLSPVMTSEPFGGFFIDNNIS